MFIAAALATACGGNSSGVGTSRADRTITSADTIAPATTDAIEPPEPATPTETGDGSLPGTVSEPSPAPAASGPGSVSADDLDSIFLSRQADLLGASSILIGGADTSAFIDETLSFTGSPIPIVIAGAPITYWSYVVVEPTFDGDAITSANGITVRYRMAVEIAAETEVGSLDDIEDAAAAVHAELRPTVEAAYPGQEVRDTVSETSLGNKVFGLAIGPEDLPTIHVEVAMHYLFQPTLVNDRLLGVTVTRRLADVPVGELPGRDVFVDDGLQAQIDLVDTATVPTDGRRSTRNVVSFNIPSAGAPTVNRFVEYDYPIPADDFESFFDAVALVLEPAGYNATVRFGDSREFGIPADHVEEKIFVERNGDVSALVGIQGDVIAYP